MINYFQLQLPKLLGSSWYRVVVVDRDPRDLYTGQVYLEKRGLDTNRTRRFCALVSITKKNSLDIYKSENILRIYLEDLIDYEQTTEKIIKFSD